MVKEKIAKQDKQEIDTQIVINFAEPGNKATRKDLDDLGLAFRHFNHKIGID